MVDDADLVFLDEPTTGLDPQARRSLWELLLDLKQRGKTVLLTTHYMDEAERLCDRVAIIDHGRIIALGTPRELIDQHFAEKAIEFESARSAHDAARSRRSPASRACTQRRRRRHALHDDVAAAIDDLLRYSNERQAPVEDLVVRRATLEDVFLELAGRRIRE